MFDLSISPVQPGKIETNLEALKAEIVKKAAEYDTMVYGDDEIAQVKADRAELNKLRGRIDDARKQVKAAWDAPLKAFDGEVKSTLAPLDAVINKLGGIVSADTERKRKERADKITSAFYEALGDGLIGASAVQKIKDMSIADFCAAKVDPKHYAPSSSLTAAVSAAREAGRAVSEEIRMIVTAEHPEAAWRKYLDTHNVMAAMAESRRVAEMLKQEQAKPAAPEVKQPEPVRQAEPIKQPEPVAAAETAQWVTLALFMTPTQARGLRQYCLDNNIAFKGVV
jgi:hypothetical protein